MGQQTFLFLILLIITVNAGDFTFELSTFCELDKLYCIDQHIREVDVSQEDDYFSTIVCGKGRLRNLHYHYDENDGVFGFDTDFELVSRVTHDCTSDGSVKMVYVRLTAFDGQKSESDLDNALTTEKKHHIRYKIDILKDKGIPETGEQTLREFEERRAYLLE